MKKHHLLAASSIGTVAATAAVLAPVASAVAAPTSGNSHTNGRGSDHSGLDEHTTLETCSADFGGTKVTVGYFDSVRVAPVFNSARAGRPVEFEFRVEDSTNNCVMSEPDNGVSIIWEVACSDPGTTIGSPDLLAAPTYDPEEKHFEQRWTPPRGKGRCYAIWTNLQIAALFRVK